MIRVEPFDVRRHDVRAITALLHRAYGAYAALGLRYTAATQDDALTLARLSRGSALIAVDAGGVIVGTVSYYNGPSEAEAASIPWYRGAEIGNFGQFAVEPTIQKGGLGARLIGEVDALARADGKGELACETALPNAPLVAYYHRRGFRDVATFRWPGDAFDCVVLSKRVGLT